MPVWWLLSFGRPMFLTPYLFHFLAHSFSALLSVFALHGVREFFMPLFRPRCALALGVVLDHRLPSIEEVEGQLYIIGNGNVLNLLFEGIRIVFCPSPKRLCL